jgi:uncharacterized protein (UPF0335 family)
LSQDQPKFESANRWLTLLANIGVVIGLVMLVIEVRHATNVAESEAYMSRVNRIDEAQVDFALSDDLARITVQATEHGVDSLSQEDLLRLRHFESAKRFRLQGQYYLWERGLLADAESLESILNEASRSSALWTELGISIEDSGLRQAVESFDGN